MYYVLRDQYISVLREVLRDLLRDVQDATHYEQFSKIFRIVTENNMYKNYKYT